MIIDFHTHVFPDNIAASAIRKLGEVGNIKAFTDGTLDGLIKSMKENQVDISVVLPVATKPEQFDSINKYAKEINGKSGIISFGGIHPDTEDYREQLDMIKELGLKGIKLHPDYQKTYVDDPKMVRVIRYASDIGLIVLLHAGMDIGLPDPVYNTPERAAAMLGEIYNLNAKIILAHTGGFDRWDEVEEHIVGKNVWLDISYSLGMMDDAQFVRIIKNHGADRALFATDSPWSGQKETYEYLKTLDFTEEELEYILHKNAEELLGM